MGKLSKNTSYSHLNLKSSYSNTSIKEEKAVETLQIRKDCNRVTMSFDLSALKILLIDDAPTIRRLIQQLLRNFGVGNIIVAANANQGMQLIETEVPDIVIVDWELDDAQSGLDLVRLIRNPDGPHNAYLPIIMLTGHTEKARIVEARDAGITEFLAKPISTRGLHARIMSVIENPRPFIRTADYFGPDRRRRIDKNYTGPERRGQEGDSIDI